MTTLEAERRDECVVPLLDQPPPPTSTFRDYLREAGKFCANASPISVQCLNYAIYLAIIQMWVGHLSTPGLAAVALGFQLNRALAFFLIGYLTTAMETIAGQAIGAKEFRVVGMTLQRAMMINICCLTPITIVAFNGEKLLLALWQDPAVAASHPKILLSHHVTSQNIEILILFLERPSSFFLCNHNQVQVFLVKSLPGTFFQVISDTSLRYLSMNKYVWPIHVAQILAIIVGLTVGGTMITTPEGAVGGAAISTIAYSGSILPFSIIGVLCLHWKTKKSPETNIWHGFSKDAFRGWCHYLRVGGGAVLMFTPKQFFMEYLFLLTGTLPQHTAASTAIAVSMLWVVTTSGVGVGFNFAAVARIGRAIGSGDISRTKLLVRIYWMVAVLISSIFAATLIIFERNISVLWTNDPEVLDLLFKLKWPTAAAILFSWTGMVSLGILGGLRRQAWGAWVAIPSFLVFGFGMAPVLIIWFEWGTLGASISFMSVFLCETCVLGILLLRVDYSTEYARVEESLRLSRLCLREEQISPS